MKKILCVDDESNVLNAFRRQLRKQFEIDTALGPEEGLEALASKGPYAVVVSDMRMPGMDGAQFLSKVKQTTPETVRIMLTGNSDQDTAIQAVNEGNIFRFLTKPCPPETLTKTLDAGIEQYRLVTAEKELLEKTLRGSIKILTDVLSLTNPVAFGRASRMLSVVRKICSQMGIKKSWQLEIAVMLSQIGCVTVPTDTLEKCYHGRSLSKEESDMLKKHPSVGRDLVRNIPRLESVADAIAYQEKCFDGSGLPEDSVAGKDIPIGARILKVALDYDTLRWSGLKDVDAIVGLRERPGRYDADILTALEATIGFEEALEVREIKLEELTISMILAADVISTDGALLVSKGQDVTPSMCERLKNFSRNRRIEEPIRVLVRGGKESRRAEELVQS